ncbi:hypothetical protein PV767_18775 [Stenotrophomonas rhizophila]|uniref:hypothetical protein n=1 Tax=Stenotrophomonas rhizophila TaxID=216778 RepID=UPI003B80B2FF
MSATWSKAELVRLAWAARRDSLARGELLQAFQAGADLYAPLSREDLGDDFFAVPGDCVAAIVMRELTGVEEAKEWLRVFSRARDLQLDLPATAEAPKRRRF